jgi:hypothetical protein
MYHFEFALLVLSFSGIIGTPVYLFLRSKMIKADFSYSKRHIFKVVILHLATMVSITLLHALILLSILQTKESISPLKLQYFIAQIVLLAVALYGGGMYITCILVEHFAAPNNKQGILFKKTLRLLHGPASHLIFEMAYLLAFWNIAAIQQDLFMVGTPTLFPFFTVLGAVVGIAFTFATIGNGTYILFLICEAISLPFFLTLVGKTTSGGVYAWGFMTATFLVGSTFVAFRALLRKKILLYQPINLFER